MDKVFVDTSAWIEFFRKKEPYFSLISELMDKDAICCSGIILAELLQGVKSERELQTIKEFIHVFEFLPEARELWEKAGELSFTVRKKGWSAGLSDCYIALAALSVNAQLLTLDKHFSSLGKVMDLRMYPLS